MSARVLLSALSGLPDLLESFGIASSNLLRQFGLSRADLNEPDRTGSFVDLSQLLARCTQRTNCAHFGLLLSRSVDLRSLGLVGRLAKYAPTVDAALDGLKTYFAMHDTGSTLEIEVEGEDAAMTYTIHVAGITAPEQIYDFTAGVMVNVMHEVCGADWQPTRVMLPRRLPRELGPYRAVFGPIVEFDAARAGVVFPAHWLAQAVSGADPVLYRLLLREVRAAIQQADPLICGEVRRAIVALLHADHCSRRDVAQLLGLHERTLCRRLQLSGTSFQDLLDEVRSELAQQLLRDTQAPISQIAGELGFRSSTVMARAFRRWHGVSPREFRGGFRRVH